MARVAASNAQVPPVDEELEGGGGKEKQLKEMTGIPGTGTAHAGLLGG